MMKFIGAVVGSVLTLLIVSAGPLVYLYDREAVRPAWTQFHVLWFRLPSFISAPSLLAQRDTAISQYAQAVANEKTMQIAIDGQNASIEALSAAGDREAAIADKAVQRAQQVQGDASHLEAVIKALPRPTKYDDCPALDLSDQPFVAYLKGVRP